MQAIETVYKEYRFRSRLEARWAVFFDVLGLEYEYEKEGYALDGYSAAGEALGWYLPDFWFPKLECFGEVKPTQFTELEYSKAAALEHPCLLLDGMPEAKFWCPTGACRGDVIPVEGFETEVGYRYYLSGDNFNRVHLRHSVNKGRLWYAFGESYEDSDNEEEKLAVLAAKQARFEHGQLGPPSAWEGK